MPTITCLRGPRAAFSAALSAAIVIFSPGLEAPRLFAQQIRPVSLTMTGVQLSAMPAVLAVPLVPSTFSQYWISPLNPAMPAPVASVVPGVSYAAAPVAVMPVLAPLPVEARSPREQRVQQIIDTAVYHFRVKMEPDTEAFDLLANTSAHRGLAAPDRRRRPRRFSDVLEESSNLNDPSVDAKHINTGAKPASGPESFQGAFFWEIPSSLMTALVLTAIAAAVSRTRARASSLTLSDNR